MKKPEPIDIVNMYDIFKGYIHSEEEKTFLGPLCIKSTSIDRRICRQSGNFTIHDHNVWPLDFYSVFQREMHKIFIPYKCIEEMR